MTHKFVPNLSQRLDLESSNKYVALQNVSIYYTWKNVNKQNKNKKLKMIAPTWNDEFELSEVSYLVSNIQDYTNYVIKKYEILSTNPLIHIYIHRIDNRLVF